MKIIYLHQYFNTPQMIGGTRSYEMARRFVAAGHEVHMVTSWRETDSRKGWFTTQEDGIRVHWLPVPYSNRTSYFNRVLAFFRFAVGAARKAASLKGDVVFATSTPLTIALPAIYASRRLDVPMVFEVRDLWPELPIAMGALRNRGLQVLAQWLEKLAYRASARIVALSPGMKDGVVRAGYPTEKVAVIPNSSDISVFGAGNASPDRFLQGYPWLAGKKIVLYPGTIGLINGVSWLVDLAAAARDIGSDAHFVVVGDGMERERVEQRAKDKGVLGCNFHMLPPMSKQDIASAFSASAVIISLFLDLPEMQANSANKFFDAMAAGKPIVINYGGWQKALLKASGAGLALDRDVNMAAEALVNMLGSQEILAEMSGASRKLAETQFSRDILAGQLERVLHDAVVGRQ